MNKNEVIMDRSSLKESGTVLRHLGGIIDFRNQNQMSMIERAEEMGIPEERLDKTDDINLYNFPK